jgi:adhesin/invasin
VGGNAITNGSPATVTFVAGAPSTTSPGTALSIVTNNAPADGSATNSVQAHITDANGNAVAGQTVTFAIASGTGTFVGTATVTTDANGNAVITLTSTVSGSVGITATVGGNAITNGSPATVIFMPVPDTSVPTTNLSIVTNNAIANGTATNSVEAHITDKNGNPIASQAVTFTIASGTGTFVGTATVTTDVNGNAIISLTSTVAGSVGITATIGGQAITFGSPATVIFVAGPPDISNPSTQLTIVTNNAAANGTATNSVQAHIVDANGNPVANQTVTFAVASGTANIVGTATVTTDINGNATIMLTSTVVGSADIAAQVGGSTITNGSPVTLAFTAQPDPTNPQTLLTVIVNNAFADGVSTNSVEAHVVDQNGDPLPGRNVVFTIDSGSAQIITSQPVQTDANGNAIIQLTSKVTGYVTITAQVENIPIVFGSPARVQFIGVDIYVPKIFTPNGDGVNDVLKPILVGMSAFHYFSVYNRWGNLLFTTEDANIGWDGTFKGTPQPIETYLWIAEGIDNNGNRVLRKGMTSLVR